MRRIMARLMWVLVAIPSVARSAERQASFPYGPPDLPLLKTSWLQGLAERFSNYIDVLSFQFSFVLGSWSREPLVLAITPAKILLLLFTFIIGFALAGLARVVILRYHSLGRTKPITERYWRNGILFALRRALSGFFIFTGAFFASVPILPHIGLALGGFPTFAIAAKFAELGYFATALGFCFRIARLVQNWLNTLAKSPSNRWYFAGFPVLGKALNYNLILFAFSAAIYILELPAPLQRAGYTIVAIAWIVANDVLLIQTVLAVESMVVSRVEILKYDVYKRRRLATRALLLRRLLIFVIVLVGIGATLMTFQPVRQIGTGLLASAGIAGVIAGFAAQKSLSTLIAGLQIAIT